MVIGAGGGDGAPAAAAEGVPELVAELLRRVPPGLRRPPGPLLYAIDHCFGIRGQGTVLTGTVLRVSTPVSQSRLQPKAGRMV
jgi:selenocysteine-specific elongation factor